MVWYFKPYSITKNLGAAYNQYCEMVPDNDWICLMDGDCMFLRADFGHLIEKYIAKWPHTKLFIPVVNRVGKGSQCHRGKRSADPNIINHKTIADRVGNLLEVKDMNGTKAPSMPCFIFSKKTYNQIGGFDETGNILGVDLRFSRKACELGKCYRMNGLYMFHYYRLKEGYKSLKHIK
jgi:GT2 family glycosyltransferase